MTAACIDCRVPVTSAELDPGSYFPRCPTCAQAFDALLRNPEDCACGAPINGGGGGLCHECRADSEADMDTHDRTQQRHHREFGR